MEHEFRYSTREIKILADTSRYLNVNLGNPWRVVARDAQRVFTKEQKEHLTTEVFLLMRRKSRILCAISSVLAHHQ